MSPRVFVACVVCCLAFGFPQPVSARVWTDDSGKKVDAEYQKFDFKTRQVTLKPKKGKVTTISIDSLSADDQKVVYRLQGPPLGKPLPPGPAAPKLTPEQATEKFLALGGKISYPNQDKTEKARVSIHPACKDPDAALEVARMLPPFEDITVSFAKVTPAGLAHLGEMRNMETAQLISIPVLNDSTVRYLTGIPQLRSLHIYNSSCTEQALTSVAAMPSLEGFLLSNCPLKGKDVAVLKGAKKLAVLELISCDVDDAGLQAACEIPSLVFLRIPCSSVTDKGLAALKLVPKLQQLSIRGSKVTDMGMKAVGELSVLRILEIEDTAVTDAGLAPLTGMKQLYKIAADRTKVTPAGAKSHLDTMTTSGKTVTTEPAKPGVPPGC